MSVSRLPLSHFPYFYHKGRFQGSPHPSFPQFSPVMTWEGPVSRGFGWGGVPKCRFQAPPRPQVSLLVLSAALEDAPPALAPHGPTLAALCRGGLEPGAPPSTLAYALRALGGLAATLGDAHTVSGGFGAPQKKFGGFRGLLCEVMAVSGPPL